MAKTRIVLDGVTPGSTLAPQVARQEDEYQAGTYYDNEGNVVTGGIPQRQHVVRGWREYHDGPRVYYYRDRYPPRRYGYEAAPAPFPFFGR